MAPGVGRRGEASGTLVGRVAELAALVAVLEQSTRRGGGLVTVEGEAGIGKSALVHALAREARGRGCRVLAATADPLSARLPLQPVVELLESGGLPFEAAHGSVKDLLQGSRDGDADSPRPEVELRIADVVLEGIDDAAARFPLCLIVEDLHWADSATLTLLGRLAREVPLLAAMLVLTRRPSPRGPALEALLRELDAAEAHQMVLPGLEESACEALALNILGVPAGPRLARQLAGAAGNPLFISELLGSATVAGAITMSAERAELDAGHPATPLPVAILRRLSHLAPETLELLRLAAVVGVRFDVAEVAALDGRRPGELVAALTEAIDGGALAEEGGSLVFRHELIRDALYFDTAASIRRALHRELAAALERDGAPPGRVAEHVRLGAQSGDLRAAQTVADAARASMELAPGVAIELFDQAVELAGAAADVLADELASDRAMAFVRAGRPEAADVCRAVLASPSVDGHAGALRLALMEALVEQARMEELGREVEQALASGTLGDRETLVARAWGSAALLFTGRLDDAHAEASFAFSQGGALDEDLAFTLGAGVLTQLDVLRGRFAAAAERSLQAADHATRRATRAALRGQPHSTVFLALCPLDRLDEAREQTRRGRMLTEQAGLVGPLGVFHFIAAYIEWQAGRWDDALAELEVNRRLAREHSWTWRVAPLSTRALVLLHRDELTEADDCLRQAEAELARGATFGVELLVLARALLDEARGDAAQALARLAAGWDGFEAAGVRSAFPVLGADLVRLAADHGDDTRVGRVAAALDALAADNPGVPTLDALALRARGVADDDGSRLVRAVERQREGPRPLELAAACESAAGALSAGGRRAEAADLLREACTQYEALRASRDVRRVEAALREAGVRRGARGRRGRPSTGWAALTDTELRVVRLVAERLTNPEIAARMFISRRTVQTHVSSALRKLGVTSRRELAEAAAREAGWRWRVEDDHPEGRDPAG